MSLKAWYAFGLTLGAVSLAPGAHADSKREAVMTMNTYVYKRVGPCEITLDVYARGTPAQPRPVVITLHGGGLITGGRYPIAMDLFGPLIEKGFVVVSPDYRLAPETKLPEILEDVCDAYRWVRERGSDLFQGDPDRVGVHGGSAGGYLTLMTGCRVQPRPKVLVSHFGYGNIRADWYARPDPFYRTKPLVEKEAAYSVVGEGVPCGFPQEPRRGEFYLYCRQQGLWCQEVAGIDPLAHPEALDPFCPAFNVTADYPPTLLAHGTDDTDVPYSQSVEMAEALNTAHVEYELVTLEGAGHGFSHPKPGDREAALARSIAFLIRHLEGPRSASLQDRPLEP